jgi:hypothetical protein
MTLRAGARLGPYEILALRLKIDPNFDPLRKNLRFQKLVASWK